MHESPCTKKGCGVCRRLVCKCLKISEEALLEALTGREINTVKDIRRITGAGDGCTCCHKLLKTYLDNLAAATV